MKKLIATLVIGGFLAASLVGCGPSTTTEDKTVKPNPTGTGAPPAGTPAPTSGKVTKADAGKISIGDKAFDVPDSAKVTIDGAEKKPADLKDLKPDDKTTGTVNTDKDGKVTAVDVKTK